MKKDKNFELNENQIITFDRIMRQAQSTIALKGKKEISELFKIIQHKRLRKNMQQSIINIYN